MSAAERQVPRARAAAGRRDRRRNYSVAAFVRHRRRSKAAATSARLRVTLVSALGCGASCRRRGRRSAAWRRLGRDRRVARGAAKVRTPARAATPKPGCARFSTHRRGSKLPRGARRARRRAARADARSARAARVDAASEASASGSREIEEATPTGRRATSSSAASAAGCSRRELKPRLQTPPSRGSAALAARLRAQCCGGSTAAAPREARTWTEQSTLMSSSAARLRRRAMDAAVAAARVDECEGGELPRSTPSPSPPTPGRAIGAAAGGSDDDGGWASPLCPRAWTRGAAPAATTTDAAAAMLVGGEGDGAPRRRRGGGAARRLAAAGRDCRPHRCRWRAKAAVDHVWRRLDRAIEVPRPPSASARSCRRRDCRLLVARAPCRTRAGRRATLVRVARALSRPTGGGHHRARGGSPQSAHAEREGATRERWQQAEAAPRAARPRSTPEIRAQREEASGGSAAEGEGERRARPEATSAAEELARGRLETTVAISPLQRAHAERDARARAAPPPPSARRAPTSSGRCRRALHAAEAALAAREAEAARRADEAAAEAAAHAERARASCSTRWTSRRCRSIRSAASRRGGRRTQVRRRAAADGAATTPVAMPLAALATVAPAASPMASAANSEAGRRAPGTHYSPSVSAGGVLDPARRAGAPRRAQRRLALDSAASHAAPRLATARKLASTRIRRLARRRCASSDLPPFHDAAVSSSSSSKFVASTPQCRRRLGPRRSATWFLR